MLHSKIARQAGVPLASLAADQLPTLPDQLAAHAKHMWLASAVDVHVSKLQTDVSSALAMAGIPNTIEWLTDDGLFSIDIAFEVRVKECGRGRTADEVFVGQLLSFGRECGSKRVCQAPQRMSGRHGVLFFGWLLQAHPLCHMGYASVHKPMMHVTMHVLTPVVPCCCAPCAGGRPEGGCGG
jgi:hypothetical protein